MSHNWEYSTPSLLQSTSPEEPYDLCCKKKWNKQRCKIVEKKYMLFLFFKCTSKGSRATYIFQLCAQSILSGLSVVRVWIGLVLLLHIMSQSLQFAWNIYWLQTMQVNLLKRFSCFQVTTLATALCTNSASPLNLKLQFIELFMLRSKCALHQSKRFIQIFSAL